MLSNTHFSMAVHVLSALAYGEGELIGSEMLAKTVGTNPSFLRGLIGELREAGLVETRLGKGGGAILSRPASEITLYDVYRATESKPAVTTHTCDGKLPCPVAKGMDELLSTVSGRIEKALEAELKGMTLSDLVADFIGKRA